MDCHHAILQSFCKFTVVDGQSAQNLGSLALPPGNLPQGKHNLLCLLETGQPGLSSNPSSVAVKLYSLKGHLPSPSNLSFSTCEVGLPQGYGDGSREVMYT